MAEQQPAMIQEGQATVNDKSLTVLEESLLSLEKLDRASPEMWPEAIPGISEYIEKPADSPPPPEYRYRFSIDDLHFMHELGTMSPKGLINKVKDLHNAAYQLGVEEGKQITRGKYLNVFKSKSRHS